jgi:hypothetical protein
MRFKQFLASTVAVALVANVSTPIVSLADSVSFADVNEKSPFYQEITTLTGEGVIQGYPDGTFRPNQPLTRGQVAKLLVRALKLETPSNANALVSSFTDIKPGSEYANEIAALVQAGIVTIQDSAQFNLGAPLTRDVMASWLVKAFKLQSIEGIQVPLSDLGLINPTHAENVKVLYQNQITLGNTDGTYGPLQSVNRGQFAAFMYRSIYQIETIENPSTLKVDISEKVFLPETLKVTYKNGKTGSAKIAWNVSEYHFTRPGTYQVMGSIAGSTKKALATVITENQPLSITSVTGVNLKQVEIQFNHDRVVKSMLENENYYTFITSSNERVRVLDAELNGKTVLLTLDKALDNNGKSTLLIHKDILGSEYHTEVSTLDTTVPVISNIEPVNKTTLKVTFSEVVDFKTDNESNVLNQTILSAFGINAAFNSIQSITVQKHGKEALIELYSPLKEGNYTLSINDQLRDYANFKLGSPSSTFIMKYDTSLPAVTGLKDVYPNQYTIVFNKPITLYNKTNIASYFQHPTSNASKVIQTGANELTIYLSQQGSITGSSKLTITPGALMDLWGNENRLLEQTIQIPNDAKGPEITKVEMIQESATQSEYVQLLVTFNEPVNLLEALDKTKYSLVDDKQQTVYIKRVDKDSSNLTNRTFTLTLDTKYGEYKKGSYTLHANNMKDLLNNINSLYAFTFLAGSERNPGNFDGNVLLNNDEVRFIVDYKEEMATSGLFSILDLTKYELKVGSTSVLLNKLDEDKNITVTIHTSDRGKTAEIVLSSNSSNTNNILTELRGAISKGEWTKLQLGVGVVADSDGNRTDSLSNIIKLNHQPTFTLAVNGATAVSSKLIQLTFDEKLQKLDPNDFIVYYDQNKNGSFDLNEAITKKGITDISTVNDTSILNIELLNEIEYDASYNNGLIYITTKSDTTTTNRYGQKIQIGVTKVMDKIAPQLVKENGVDKITAKAATTNGKGIVTLEFTEKIDPSTVSRLSFSVGNGKYPVESVEVVGNSIQLTVDLKGEQISSLVGESVKQISAIADMGNNLVTETQGVVLK